MHNSAEQILLACEPESAPLVLASLMRGTAAALIAQLELAKCLRASVSVWRVAALKEALDDWEVAGGMLEALPSYLEADQMSARAYRIEDESRAVTDADMRVFARAVG